MKTPLALAAMLAFAAPVLAQQMPPAPDQNPCATAQSVTVGGVDVATLRCQLNVYFTRLAHTNDQAVQAEARALRLEAQLRGLEAELGHKGEEIANWQEWFRAQQAEIERLRQSPAAKPAE